MFFDKRRIRNIIIDNWNGGNSMRCVALFLFSFSDRQMIVVVSVVYRYPKKSPLLVGATTFYDSRGTG